MLFLVVMKFLVALLLGDALASVSDLTFDAQIGYYGMPCVMGRLEGEDSDTRCFHLSLSSRDIILRGARRSDYTRDVLLTQSNQGDGSGIFRMDRSQATIPHEWRDYTDYLGVGFRSDFGTAAGSMMLLPRNPDEFGTDFQMIVNPRIPSSYCLDGHLALADVIADTPNLVEIEVSVIELGDDPALSVFGGTVSATNNQTYMYLFETLEDTRIPSFAFDIITRTLSVHGVRRITHGHYGPGCELVIPNMPTIQFSVLSEGQHVANLLMSGRDYMSVNERTGNCKLHILPAADNDFRIGMSVLERVGLFFDYRSGRLGFCEPL